MKTKEFVECQILTKMHGDRTEYPIEMGDYQENELIQAIESIGYKPLIDDCGNLWAI